MLRVFSFLVICDGFLLENRADMKSEKCARHKIYYFKFTAYLPAFWAFEHSVVYMGVLGLFIWSAPVLWFRSNVSKLIVLGSDWDHGLRGGRPPAEARMRPDLIVVANASLRQHLCLLHGVKQLAIQEFSSHASVEALDIAIFPRATRFNKSSDRTSVA